jgi:hypothetical protein
MVKVIVCTLTSSQSNTSKKAIARGLGVDRQNISIAMLRCAQLDNMNDNF